MFFSLYPPYMQSLVTRVTWEVYVNNMAAAAADSFPSYLPLFLLEGRLGRTETSANWKTKISSIGSYMIAVHDALLHQEISPLNEVSI